MWLCMCACACACMFSKCLIERQFRYISRLLLDFSKGDRSERKKYNEILVVYVYNPQKNIITDFNVTSNANGNNDYVGIINKSY